MLIMQHPLFESEIVKSVLCEVGKNALSGSSNLVLCLWRRKEILRPPATRRSPEEATGAAHDSSAVHISVSWQLGFRQD